MKWAILLNQSTTVRRTRAGSGLSLSSHLHRLLSKVIHGNLLLLELAVQGVELQVRIWGLENGSHGELGLQGPEGFLCSRRLQEENLHAGERKESCCHGAVVPDETLAEIGEPQEAL